MAGVVKSRRHNKHNTRIYRIWLGMKKRCLNPKTAGWENYGGRGIEIYKEWLDFRNFYKDMSNSYKTHCRRYGEQNTSIDRINNDKNYEPANCRWVTRLQQNNNKRPQRPSKHWRFITYKGLTKTIDGWARYLKMTPSVLHNRFIRRPNDPLEVILSSKRYKGRKDGKLITFNGVTLNVKGWAKKLGIKEGTMARRFQSRPIKEAIEMPAPDSDQVPKEERMVTEKEIGRTAIAIQP